VGQGFLDMQAEGFLMRGLRGVFATAGLAVLGAMVSVQARADELLGQPTPGAIGLQPAASSLKHHAIWFHDLLLLPIITAITLFVLVLLLIIIFRFNAKANPTPAKFAHNTPLEIAWTVIPVLILLTIAVFSFQFLFEYHTMPKPDVTVKVTGYQWYWGYTYPDQKIDEYTSNVLTADAAKAAGKPYLLGTDNPLVVPVHKNVRVLVTGADVIHDWAMPAFGLKTDAVPGRTNETWFNAEKVGTYYGECDQLCGVNHDQMPIEIKVVSQSDFDAWVASKAPPPAPASGAPAAASAAAAAAPTAKPAAAPAPQKVAMNAAAAVLR
jgi:cytochrome c oxidase subunit 2